MRFIIGVWDRLGMPEDFVDGKPRRQVVYYQFRTSGKMFETMLKRCCNDVAKCKMFAKKNFSVWMRVRKMCGMDVRGLGG
jgi:hypothetical protein